MTHIPSPEELDSGFSLRNSAPVRRKRCELVRLLKANPQGTEVDAQFFLCQGANYTELFCRELKDAGWQVFRHLGQNVIWRHFAIVRPRI